MSVRTWFPRVLGGIGLTLMALSTLHAQIPHVAERLPSIFDEAAADGGSGEGDEGGEANVADSLKSLDERLKKLEKSGKDVEGIKKDLGTRGPGVFSVPGLMKIQVRKKPATKAIKGWTNPFTGEKQDKPARPASKTVKIRPLKKLKEMV